MVKKHEQMHLSTNFKISTGPVRKITCQRGRKDGIVCALQLLYTQVENIYNAVLLDSSTTVTSILVQNIKRHVLFFLFKLLQLQISIDCFHDFTILTVE